ncbi:hypothetical protein FB45DRAFT_1062089 [Roridomyces roridus]|uniref:Uncharacterized protein n=1 Tax=Roridomyces roridus TaxID=1738132 RepID=A0AAD7BHI7_9AGAR|nr:hypothetical protein FB45DRAFT_1062089 [Roridomyces roridus]
MPVSFAVAKHPAQSFTAFTGHTAKGILQKACPNEDTKVDEILQFSIADNTESRDIYSRIPGLALPNQNGFVATLLEAYTKDRALVIRPDDVWLAILSQFNFFVTGRAELLRASFVAHEGKRELVIDCRPKTVKTIDFGDVAREMAGLIEKNVVDPSLRTWATPSFTSTTLNDTICGCVLLMATLKHYFEYKILAGGCGIPRVTLDGERSDWVDILGRLEKLKEYGIETTAWYHLLQPVVTRFVRRFRRANYGSGDFYTGWITAFTVFSKEGKWLGPFLNTDAGKAIDPAALTAAQFWATYAKTDHGRTDHVWDMKTPYQRLVLDDTPYHRLSGGAVPPGYAEVGVKIVDFDQGPGVTLECAMVAGNIGTRVSSSGDRSLSASGTNDTVQPVAGWWMFTCVDEKEQQERALEARGMRLTQRPATSFHSMPVSFPVAKHPAQSFTRLNQVHGARETLASACPNQAKKADKIFKSTFGSDRENIPLHGLVPNQNGLVATLLEAYTHDRALVLRPDDVWLAILCQFNFFVTARAELLRANFVAHEGKRELTVFTRALTPYGVDFDQVASQMSDLIEKNVVDPALRAWASPSFTTTTVNDTTVGAILLMATLQEYFEFKVMMFGCGIPRVTLEGTKSDWVDILNRIEKLKEYGIETTAWYHLLRPVIGRFVAAFDEPNHPGNVDFWQRVAHYQPGGSGRGDYYSGWVTAFTVFSKEGKWLGLPLNATGAANVDHTTLTAADFWATFANPDALDHAYGRKVRWGGDPKHCLVLDDTPYHILAGSMVPPGVGEVNVKLVDTNVSPEVTYQCVMVAGNVGMRVFSSGDRSLSVTGANDTVQSVAGWWIYTCLPDTEQQEDQYGQSRNYIRGYN